MVIVSAYFKIPSKQPHSFYQSHLKRFFRSITSTIIFYTTPDIHNEIISYDYNLSHVTFQYIDVKDLSGWSAFDSEFWNRQQICDPEKYHTPELSVMWFEKKEFILRASLLLPQEDVFIWCDAGCIRDDASEIAAKDFGKRLDTNDNKLHVQFINFWSPKKQDFYIYPQVYIACAIIVGNRNAWQDHSILYNTICKQYDSANITCNSDQYILQSCIDKNPNLYKIHYDTVKKVNEWFFFLAYV